MNPAETEELAKAIFGLVTPLLILLAGYIVWLGGYKQGKEKGRAIERQESSERIADYLKRPK